MSIPSDVLSVREWLASQSLDEARHLYVVMSNASDANPLRSYYQQAKPVVPLPLWEDTPYAGWQEVMPYLGELHAESPFFDWIEQQTEQGWGWLALSSYSAETVRDHLRGLIQVRMPDGAEVFFRYWDGRHLAPILSHLGGAAGDLLPVFDRYWINGQTLSVECPPLPSAKAYPWWDVPPDLLAKLSAEDPAPLVDDLLQWLREAHADLYFVLPETNLRLKVEHFVRHHSDPLDDLSARLKDSLQKELTP